MLCYPLTSDLFLYVFSINVVKKHIDPVRERKQALEIYKMYPLLTGSLYERYSKRHHNTALLEGEKYMQCFGITGSVHLILTRNERSLKRVCLEKVKYVLCYKTLIISLGKTREKYIQFSSVAQSCPTLCDPMNRSMPGLHAHHQLRSILGVNKSAQDKTLE